MNKILFGDCIEQMQTLPDGVAQMCVTSPPYFGLRDYGVDGQIGLEQAPEEFVARLVEVFREVHRVLADDGTLWLNIGDSYAGGGGGNYTKNPIHAPHGQHITNVRNKPEWLANSGLKAKDLIGIPWMLAFALRADGWYLRQDIIWHKPNPMPESVRDRCTKAHEYVFLLSKSPKYFFDSKAMREEAQHPKVTHKSSRKSPAQESAFLGNAPTNLGRCGTSENGTRNRRSVWTVATRPYKGAHFATFPPALIEPCILAGSRPGDIVLDPFMGSGTTAAVAVQHERQYIGCELNEKYEALQNERINNAINSININNKKPFKSKNCNKYTGTKQPLMNGFEEACAERKAA